MINIHAALLQNACMRCHVYPGLHPGLVRRPVGVLEEMSIYGLECPKTYKISQK